MAPRAFASGQTPGPRGPLPETAGTMVDRLLDAAQALIQKKGYNGFSYDDVSRMVGLKKPSIHHYFPRKEDLGASVARRYTDRFALLLDEIDAAGSDAAQRLGLYLALFVETYGIERRICPCGILGAEMDALPPLVAEAAHRFFQLNLAWLITLLSDGREAGALSYDGPASAMAVLLLSTLEGAMVVGRGLGDDQALRQAGSALLNNLRATSQAA